MPQSVKKIAVRSASACLTLLLNACVMYAVEQKESISVAVESVKADTPFGGDADRIRRYWNAGALDERAARERFGEPDGVTAKDGIVALNYKMRGEQPKAEWFIVLFKFRYDDGDDVYDYSLLFRNGALFQIRAPSLRKRTYSWLPVDSFGAPKLQNPFVTTACPDVFDNVSVEQFESAKCTVNKLFGTASKRYVRRGASAKVELIELDGDLMPVPFSDWVAAEISNAERDWSAITTRSTGKFENGTLACETIVLAGEPFFFSQKQSSVAAAACAVKGTDLLLNARTENTEAAEAETELRTLLSAVRKN